MRVLIACEFSGVVRRAFRARGHDAYSCDLLPAEDGSRHHVQGDICDLLYRPHRLQIVERFTEFDLLIAHPTCTFLTNSSVRWLHSDPTRWEKMLDGAHFFQQMLEAPIPRIAVENPIMHKYAVEIIGRRQDQVIQPWMFGHGETKATCLWLKNLPKLIPTDIVEGREARVHKMSPGPDRWKERSRTLTGIAEAMAAQWGSL